MAFHITSTAFEENAQIPQEYTCDGDDTSPKISWHEPPKGTASYALICEDPDAPDTTFTHWIVYNLPPDRHELEPVIPIEKNLRNGAIHGKNDFGKYGYRGPCPPKGEDHRYLFKVFALKKKLEPESAANRGAFYKAIKGNVIDQAEYNGKYRH